MKRDIAMRFRAVLVAGVWTVTLADGRTGKGSTPAAATNAAFGGGL